MGERCAYGTAKVEECLVDCSSKVENRGVLHVGFAELLDGGNQGHDIQGQEVGD
jgi:hypothetical protein